MAQAVAFIIDKVVTAVVTIGNAIGLPAGVTIAIAKVAAFATPFVVSAAVNAALAPSIPGPESGKQTIKQATPSRRRGIGRIRLGGAGYMLYEASANVLHKVMAIADGPAVAMGQVWLHDDEVQVVAGVVQDTPSGAYEARNQRVKLDYRLGHATETPYTALVTAMPGVWTSNHRGDGIVSAYLRCANGDLDDFPRQFPHGDPEFSAEWEFPAYDWRDSTQIRDDVSTWKFSDNVVVNLITELFHVRAYDWAERIAPTLASHTAEANYCDDLIRLKNDQVIDLGYDPELGSLGSITVPAYEKRYALGGFYDLSNAPADILSRYLTCMDGFLAQRGDGAFIIKAGRYDEPTVTFTDEHVVGLTVTPFVEDETAVNKLVVTFTSPDHGYTEIETDPWEDEDDIAARGEEKPQPFSLPWVQANGQARRLAKRRMSRLVAPLRGTVVTDLTGIGAVTERYVRLQVSDIADLNDLVVEIVQSPEIDLVGMTVTFTWIAADPNIDAWNPATEEGDGPSTESRPAREPLTAPTISAVQPFAAAINGTAEGVRLRVTGNGPARDDLIWAARWRVEGGVSWAEANYTDADPTAAVVMETGFVAAGVNVEVEIAYTTGGGTLSPWSDATVISTAGVNVAPSTPTGLGATPGSGHAALAWTNSTTSNFASAKVWRAATGSDFSAATAVSGDLTGTPGAAGSYDNTGVAAGTYLYWVTAKATGGAVSAPVGPITVTIP